MLTISSITEKTSRRVFTVFVLLSCMLPLLLMIFIIYRQALPRMDPIQGSELGRVFHFGMAAVATLQALGAALWWWWVGSVERLARDVEDISTRCLGPPETAAPAGGSELLKLDHLVKRLGGELQISRQQADDYDQQLRELNEKLSTLENTDALTQLYNRRHFTRQLAQAARRADRLKMGFWLVRLEVEGLAGYGEKNADHILKGIGRIIQQRLPAHALPFAIDRNEFTLIIPRSDGREIARTTYQLVQAMEAEKFVNPQGVPLGAVRIFCGIAGYRKDLETLCAEAQQALETARRCRRPIEVAGL